MQKPPCGMSAFSHGLFARQVPPETMVQTTVQKLLSFWTAPSLIALLSCLRNDPTAGAGGSGAVASYPGLYPWLPETPQGQIRSRVLPRSALLGGWLLSDPKGREADIRSASPATKLIPIMTARIVAALRRMKVGADPLGPHTHRSSGSHPAHHPLAPGTLDRR